MPISSSTRWPRWISPTRTATGVCCFRVSLEKGAGVCRHLAILYQLCLQEAGVPSRLVKGEHRLLAFGGRHAWNVAWLSGRAVLVDVTLPSGGGPFILTGDSLGDVYEEASTKHHRSCRPSTNSDSFHRIRVE